MGTALGVWVFGSIVVLAIAFLYIGRQAAKCPNCGAYTVFWKGMPGGRANAFTLVGSGGVFALAGLMSGDSSCVGGGLLIGAIMVAMGAVQWRTAKGRCATCNKTVKNAAMLRLLSETTED